MSERVVIVELLGGLGNQLFQYAAGRALAASNDAQLYLDKDAFVHYKLRQYELGCYQIHENFWTPEHQQLFGFSKTRTFKGIVARLRRKLKKIPVLFYGH